MGKIVNSLLKQNKKYHENFIYSIFVFTILDRLIEYESNIFAKKKSISKET